MTLAQRLSTFALLWAVFPPIHSAHGQSENYPATGTLISAFGNANGLVVATDGVASTRNASGRTIRIPARKLFRYDDRTVCAIAGLGGTPVPAAPQLNSDILGIVAAYRDQIQSQGIKQPLAVTLSGLSGVLQFYLANFAEINAYTGHEGIVSDYYLELLLVGFDLDGAPKICELIIKAVPNAQGAARPRWTTDQLLRRISPVGRQLTTAVRGMSGIALDALAHPEKIDGYKIFATYRAKMNLDRGASISLDEMEQIQRALINMTANQHPEVGEPKQIAILQGGRIIRFEQQFFAPPSRPFALFVVTNSVLGSGLLFRGDFVKLYESTEFNDPPMSPTQLPRFLVLDGSVFLNCTFRNQHLWYDGGSLYLDDTNRNIGSTVGFGPNAGKRPDVVQHLLKLFAPPNR